MNDVGMVLILFLGVSLAFSVWNFYLLRVSYLLAIVLSLTVSGVALACAVMLSMQRESTIEWNSMLRVFHQRVHNYPWGRSAVIIFVFVIAANLGCALLAKLYRAIVLEQMTTAERSPDAAGFRAWLSPMNVITVVAFAIACMIVFDSGVDMLFIGLCTLLAIPTVNTLLQAKLTRAAPPAPAAEDERQRVLALVEAGRITAEEAADLLTALAQSRPGFIDAPVPMTGRRRAVMVGAALVLIGFFLPWFAVDAVQATRAAMAAVQQSLPQFNGAPASSMTFPFATGPTDDQISLHGGDMRNGLGWITLAAGLCVAGLPMFTQRHSLAQLQQRNITFVALAVGSVVVLYLLSSSFNPATTIEPGFYLVLAGYALLWTGVLRKPHPRVQHQAAPLAAAV